jgi:hypothetical protein
VGAFEEGELMELAGELRLMQFGLFFSPIFSAELQRFFVCCEGFQLVN